MVSSVRPDALEQVKVADEAPRGIAVGRLRVRPRVALAAALFVFSLALFAKTINGGFAMDDRTLIKENESIRSLSNLGNLWSNDYWYPLVNSGLYRPIVTTSYALNYAVGAGNPRGYHVTNVVLHALVTVLVLALYLRVSGDAWLSGGAAFLFAAHAVHTEPLGNVASGRPELLGALFFLVGLLTYLARQDDRGPRRGTLYGVSLASFGVGLLCKESVATLPAVLALYDFVYRSPREASLPARVVHVLRERGAAYAGYAAILALVIAARIAILGADRTLPPEIAIDNPLFFLNSDWRVLNALAIAFRYLALFLFPLHLSYDYSYDQIPFAMAWSDPIAALTLAGCAAVAGGVVLAYRRSRDAFFWIGFYGITFAIISNVVVPIGTIMGERLLYSPSIALCMLLAMGLWRLVQWLPVAAGSVRWGFVAVMMLIVALHTARTLDRLEDWKTEERLYLHDLEVVPRSAKAMNNAAALLVHLERYDEAAALFEKAVAVAPNYAMPWQTGAFNYDLLGRSDDAWRMYEGAVRAGSDDFSVLNNLGFMLVDREIDVPRGVVLLERAVEKYPNQAEALDSLGWGYFKQGRLEDAREKIARSLEIDSWSDSTAARRKRLEEVEAALQRSQPPAVAPSK